MSTHFISNRRQQPRSCQRPALPTPWAVGVKLRHTGLLTDAVSLCPASTCPAVPLLLSSNVVRRVGGSWKRFQPAGMRRARLLGELRVGVAIRCTHTGGIGSRDAPIVFPANGQVAVGNKQIDDLARRTSIQPPSCPSRLSDIAHEPRAGSCQRVPFALAHRSAPLADNYH